MKRRTNARGICWDPDFEWLRLLLSYEFHLVQCKQNSLSIFITCCSALHSLHQQSLNLYFGLVLCYIVDALFSVFSTFCFANGVFLPPKGIEGNGSPQFPLLANFPAKTPNTGEQVTRTQWVITWELCLTMCICTNKLILKPETAINKLTTFRSENSIRLLNLVWQYSVLKC